MIAARFCCALQRCIILCAALVGKRGQGIDLEMNSEQSSNGVERVTHTYCQLSCLFYTCHHMFLLLNLQWLSQISSCSHLRSLRILPKLKFHLPASNFIPLAVTNNFIHTLLTPFSASYYHQAPPHFFYIPSCLRIAFFPFFLSRATSHLPSKI